MKHDQSNMELPPRNHNANHRDDRNHRESRSLRMILRRCTLSDMIAANMKRPDVVPTPPVDLIQILMGELS